MELWTREELAQRAAQDVAVVSSNLLAKWSGSWFTRRQTTKRLLTLATSLQGAALSQDKYDPGDHRKKYHSAAELETFLCGLEFVCTVRAYPLVEAYSSTNFAFKVSQKGLFQVRWTEAAFRSLPGASCACYIERHAG